MSFYNKEIDIFTYCKYEDDNGFEREAYKKVNHDSAIMVDLQPYSTEKAKVEYGYDIKCTRRMFCDVIDEIKESSVIKYKNKFYKVEKIPWDDGYYEILLSETDNILSFEEVWYGFQSEYKRLWK